MLSEWKVSWVVRIHVVVKPGFYLFVDVGELGRREHPRKEQMSFSITSGMVSNYRSPISIFYIYRGNLDEKRIRLKITNYISSLYMFRFTFNVEKVSEPEQSIERRKQKSR